jgi:hypothetical protein
VILEDSFDELMQEVRCKELVDICPRRTMCKRLIELCHLGTKAAG